MKRSIFTAVAALALLLAMPVVAQEEEPYENRTNPDARSIAPGSGLTLTGTVVEWNDEQLVVRSATGVEHFQILPDTQKPVTLEPGQNVSVDYTRTAQGVMIAQQIRPEGTATGEVTSETTVDTESSLTAETEVDEPAIDEPDVTAGLETEADADLDAGLESDLDTEVETTTADTGFESDLDTGLDEETTDDEPLPATGSKLPLVGLLGLLGVAAALGLRSFLR